MPGYGIAGPDAGTGLLPWRWAEEKLVASHDYWVVTVCPDGSPHAMPVWGVWDDAMPGFMWSCAPGSRKAANVAANPQVCVMADSTVEVVSVEGRATRLTDDAMIEPWIERYLTKYDGEGVTADFLRANACFEMVPERGFGIIEREDAFSTRATRWRFE